MLVAIAITPVWDEVKESVIKPGEEFRMTDDKVLSLINIGAAKLKPAPALDETEEV